MSLQGKIPKNVFGNIELFHQNMLPKATVHLLLPDASQIAKRLGLEFARAMTGFDFVRGKAVPRIQGIVVKECDVEVIKLVRFISMCFFS